MERFGAIEDVLSTHLHQDWYLQFADSSAALHAAAKACNIAELNAVHEQLDQLIESVASSSDVEGELAEMCLRLGIYFDPASGGLSYLEWLGVVRSIFLEELNARAASERPITEE